MDDDTGILVMGWWRCRETLISERLMDFLTSDFFNDSLEYRLPYLTKSV
jgi:hypothetical protein